MASRNNDDIGSARRLKRLLWISFIYILIGLASTTPLVLFFGSGIPFSRAVDARGQVQSDKEGDHLQLYYRFWLLKATIAGDSGLYEDKYEFNLGNERLRPVSGYFMPFSVVYVIFSFISGPFGYNASIIFSYALAAFSMYLLVYHYTGDRLSSVLAGIVFAVAPYRTASVLSGHPTGLGMAFVPLYFYALEKFLQSKSIGFGVLFGIVFAVMTDNDLHVLYLSALLTPVILLKHFIRVGARNLFPEVRKLILPAIPLILLCIGAVALKYHNTLLLKTGAAEGGRTIEELRVYAPGWPNDILSRSSSRLAHYAYLGGVAAVFVLLAFITRIFLRNGKEKHRVTLSAFTLFFALLVISYLLAFGVNSPLRGLFIFFRDYVPWFSMIRQSAKMMILAVFALSVSVGFAFSVLRRIVPARIAGALSIIILLGILVDSSPLPARGAGIALLPHENESYEKVFGDKPDERVVCVPIWPGDSSWSSLYMYYTTLYRTIMINGYNPVITDEYKRDVFFPLIHLNAGQIQQKQYDVLRNFKADYLIFHEEAFPPKVCLFPAEYAIENLKQSPYLELITEDRPILVFKILREKKIESSLIPFGSAITGVVHEAENANDFIEDPAASNGRVLVLKEGESASTGIRRRTTPAGDYVLTSRVKADSPCSLNVSIFNGNTEDLILEQSLPVAGSGEYEYIEMPFNLEEATSVRYVITRSDDGPDVTIDWFYLRFANQQDPLLEFEIEDTFHTGNLVSVDGASGGDAVRLTDFDPSGNATRGPYRLYEPGKYRLTLRFGIDWSENIEDTDKLLCFTLLDVAHEPRNRQVHENRAIILEDILRANQLSREDESVSFTTKSYEFQLRNPTFLNIIIAHYVHTLYLDNISIERMGD